MESELFVMQLQVNGTNKETSREQQAVLQVMQRTKQDKARHDAEQKWYQRLLPKLEKTIVYEEQFCVKYLIRKKKVDKNWRNFLPVTNFFAICFFLQMFNFYRQIFLPTFFYKREQLVFSILRIPLVYLFNFKVD